MVIIQKVEGWDTNVVKDIVDKLAKRPLGLWCFLPNVVESGKIVFICKAKKCGRTCWKLGETCSGSYAR